MTMAKSSTTEARFCEACQTISKRYGSGECAECVRRKRRAARRSWSDERRQEEAERQRKSREARGAEYVRVAHLRRSYGIDVAEFDALLAEQGGGCAICKGQHPAGRKGVHGWHVDHCHKTGRVRGILCAQCNTGLGLFADDPSRLESARRYLNQSATKAA